MLSSLARRPDPASAATYGLLLSWPQYLVSGLRDYNVDPNISKHTDAGSGHEQGKFDAIA
jgi:hypothetical protein